MKSKNILFIINPASASGRTLARWENCLAKIDAADFTYDAQFTAAKKDAIQFTYDAIINKQYDIIVSVGGDGTANEVINGFMMARAHVPVLPAFTIFPSGTGSDAVRTLGITKHIDDFIGLLTKGVPQGIDIGQVSYLTLKNLPEQRYFLNACDMGIGATVAHTVNNMNQSHEKKSGKAKYFRSIMEQVFKFKPFDASYIVDNQVHYVKKTVIIAICNGMFFGGGVKVSPLSKMNDNQLECLATTDVSKVGLMGIVSKVYSGAHLGHPKIKFEKGRKIQITLATPQLLETDGEVCGMVTGGTFTVCASAILMLTINKDNSI